MKRTRPMHGSGQGWILLFMLIAYGLIFYYHDFLDSIPWEPEFSICGGK